MSYSKFELEIEQLQDKIEQTKKLLKEISKIVDDIEEEL